ncbi:pyridoxal phosphate-dependent aminotransferase [Paracraurococcus ruber]|uniref:Aminotransferase n=1 Tax=Paracraurococcus ruber TaxID=77675 RepID=A0ABS1CYA5_9PROT|nr:pyridoxal phosphate-dependent aminotransferase [Paracraurococcus ruber]MBK1658922.1 aspartate aminotransferase [Paracraurococcus ruber]TDG32319.1 aminotransferase class I/II-fold pyridoxal phosphate-dependent enzyme [Paracraurococcus ruber]
MHAPAPRTAVAALEASKIREVYRDCGGIPGLIPLWVGEPDIPTPDFIKRAANDSLAAGETFYSSNLGIEPLREAIAAYQRRIGRQVTADRICATSAGVNAIMLACQSVLDPGDRVVTLAPHWPNIGAIPLILSAPVETVPLHLAQGLWRVDLDQLLSAIRPEVRMVMLNSPGNPTGFAFTREEVRAILDHCRRTGTWILADEVYDRLYYEGGPAPSFLDIATPEDRVIAVNSFSKSWAMTGWRLGWLTAPATLVDGLAKLVEYNTSCAPVFVQRAGIAAVTQGDAFIDQTVALFRPLRDRTAAALNAVPGVTAPVAAGGMYSFFRVEGLTDSLAEAKRMAQGALVGLAPGSAFGPGGEGHFRLCFAQQEATLDRALDRVTGWLARR